MNGLRLNQVTKQYGARTAVRRASVAFEPGGIHAVIGENGAGKSTLLKMGAGIVVPDEGTVEIDGKRLAPFSAAEAGARGVAMVTQHFSLVGVFTALENIALGCEHARGPFGRMDWDFLRKRTQDFEAMVGLDVPLDVPVGELGVGHRQRVEILRALHRDANVIILDEPTAVLVPSEVDALYKLLGRLAERGRTIVVVTHKLDEVCRYAQKVTVIRQGEVVESRPVTQDADEERRLAAAIMGTTQDSGRTSTASTASTAEVGLPVLELEGVLRKPALQGVTLHVHAGEIVGVAGVEGNGQTELVEVLAGLLVPDAGIVHVAERPMKRGDIAVVHGDRHEAGLVLDATVAENLMLGELARFQHVGVVDEEAVEREVAARLKRGQVVPPDASLETRGLSGGNQQKVVMARALAAVDRGAKVLAVAHPTRGVDLKASEGIHDELRWARDKELAVLVISADLRELRSLCSRILVMTRGRIVGEFGPDASDETLGQAMLGGDHGEVEDVAGGQGHRHHPGHHQPGHHHPGHHQPGPDGDAAARTVSSEHDVEGKAP